MRVPFVPTPADPHDRTRFHEAGHAVVYWALFAVVSDTIVATHVLDASGTPHPAGWAQLQQIVIPPVGTVDYTNTIAVFLAGKLTVAKAIRCGLLPSLMGSHPDEQEYGDAGYFPYGRPPPQ